MEIGIFFSEYAGAAIHVPGYIRRWTGVKGSFESVTGSGVSYGKIRFPLAFIPKEADKTNT